MSTSSRTAHPCNIARAFDASTMNLAVQILATGGLVAIPTETVYGLGAAIDNEIAIAKIFAVKGRPHNHPLIVHIANIDELQTVAVNIHRDAIKLAHACWPGPLTLLLQRSENVSMSVTGGRDTVAVRIPDNSFTQQLIINLGSPIAAPSANRFGKVSPTTAQHVCDDLQNDVELIVDDGASIIGVESTIVDFSVTPPQLLRPGGIPIEDIEQILGYTIRYADGVSRASGMLQNHYQPSCTVLLVHTDSEAQQLKVSLASQYDRVRILNRCNNLPLYATLLYSDLRQADSDQIQALIAVLPENKGLGAAIRDRLTKAAGSGPPLPAS
ncbi:MAG: threonylcarbamoyl-AMP synthase [Ilumatobacteraceae bacterium]|nr:threonylcarbamoyl-AMP synthase [Ilumatobacteraceae bacterium]